MKIITNIISQIPPEYMVGGVCFIGLLISYLVTWIANKIPSKNTRGKRNRK